MGERKEGGIGGETQRVKDEKDCSFLNTFFPLILHPVLDFVSFPPSLPRSLAPSRLPIFEPTKHEGGREGSYPRLAMPALFLNCDVPSAVVASADT